MQNIWQFPLAQQRVINVNFKSLIQGWRYSSDDGRDLRLDLLRGFAIFAMLIDHLGSSSWLYPITGGNHFFVSAAEGFVFISGLLVGIVYGDVMLRDGLRAAMKKAWHRAWELYKLTVGLTLIFVTLVFAGNLPFEEWYAGTIDNKIKLIWDVATLHRTFVFVDVPLLYTLLMLLAPLGLYCLKHGYTRWLLSGSLLIWGADQFFPIQLSAIPWTIDGNWIFNLASWQILFFVAMTIGYHRKQLARFTTFMNSYRYFTFVAISLMGLIALYNTQLSEALLALFDKSHVALGRLAASLIVFQFAYLIVTLFWRPIYAAFGWLFNPLGQNSLYAYTWHVLFIVAFYELTTIIPNYTLYEMSINTALQLVAVGLTYEMIKHRFLFSIVPR